MKTTQITPGLSAARTGREIHADDLRALEAEYEPLRAQALPQGTSERTHRDALWTEIARLRKIMGHDQR